MTKYYRRGTREYYQVTPERVIKLINKQYRSEVTIILKHPDPIMDQFPFEDDIAQGSVEIERSEFEKEFKEASRLIVLEP